jgi:hypothetical protein
MFRIVNCFKATGPAMRLPSFFRSALFLAVSGFAVASLAQQPAATNLKTVDNPDGGQFVYGSLTGQANRTSAMVFMLRKVHEHFGAKPQIGKLLQSRDGGSLATFFTLNASTMGGRPIAGLVVISMPAGGGAQAAVLYDDASHFVSSEPSMMKSLTAAWQGSLGGSNGAGSGSPNNTRASQAPPSANPGQFYPATTGDRSAMIKAPDSWRILAVSGGQLVAEGDRGEMVQMGMIYQNIVNPQSPQAQQWMNGPMAGRGPRVVCPLGSDLFTDYVCVFNQVRRNNGKPQGRFNLTSERQQPPTPGFPPAVVAIFTVDFNDGMGPRNGSARLGLMRRTNPGAPLWALGVSMSNIPQKYGTAVDPTLKAVVESYSQDVNVINREGAADLARIQQQGQANQAQAAAINQRRENSNNAYEAHRQQLNQNDAAIDQHNADIDWQSKINQNYILDRSVIRDSADTVHATTGNNLADALVRSNPTQLEYVPNQQLVQGVDY